MKVLVFHIGAARYGLRLAAIASVLPVAALKPLPLTPQWVAGVLDLHGTPVPVIDLARLAGMAPSAPRFDTRIVIVDYMVGHIAGNAAGHASGDGGMRALGLLAERVQGVREVDTTSLADAGVRGARFLGKVATDGGAMLQLVETEHLLPADARALLFPEDAA